MNEINAYGYDEITYQNYESVRQGEPQYTHNYNDHGVLKRCTIVAGTPDSDGYVVVMTVTGEYRIEHKLKVSKIKTLAK